MNHSKNPKQPHRFERIIPEEPIKSSFTYDICQTILNGLNQKEVVVPVTSEAISTLKRLNETSAFITLIKQRAGLNDINAKEGYTEAERKVIHKKISGQAQALFDSLNTLDRDVFHDWCIEDLFTADNKYNVISAERLPDYEAEREFYETVGALAKTANHCAHKSKIELSGVSGNLATRPGIDIALNAIIASYTELTNEAPTKGGPLNLTKYEAFSIECLAIMGFKGVSDDALRHMTKKATADFSKN
jgi:hypothetical protein|tara:strand:- start:87 stop:827 length:741 start_codon:yes stop_codon:yes gene_type:complete